MNGRGFKPHVPGGPDLESNQVSVMLTLSASAAENIGGVIAAIADLLRIPVPPSYEISRSPSPPVYSATPSGFTPGVKHKEEAINIQSLMKSRSKFCHICSDVVTEEFNKPRKSDVFNEASDDQVTMSDDDFGEVVFCSEKCRKQFGVMEPPPQQPCAVSDLDVTNSVVIDNAANELSKQKEDLHLASNPPLTSIISDAEEAPKPLKLSICLGQNAVTIVSGPPLTGSKSKKALKHKAIDATDDEKPIAKRPKEVRFRHWVPSLVKTEKLYKLHTEKELTEILDQLSPVIRPKARVGDSRKCALCHMQGDAETNGPGRLLNVDADKWVHLNCALWSNEVYETMNGALMYVEVACKRGTSSECVRCHQTGATVGCFRARCPNVYHVSCAQMENVTFCQDKSVLCAMHCAKTPELESQQLSSIAVYRRVYVNRDENVQVARVMRSEDKKVAVRLGGLVIHNIGQLLPYQIHSGCFHTTECIYPVGYKAVRYFWSYRQVSKRCRYICKIEDVNGRPQFTVSVVERGLEQAVLKESSCSEIARHILEPLEKMRRENDLVKVFPTFLTGEDLFGLTEPTVQKIIESLPGVEMLSNYHFRYGRSSLYKLPLAVNPTGCARSEPRMKTHFKKPHTLHGAGNCRSLPSTVTVMPGDVNSPYLKQFVHSKSQQYRRLKTEWRNNVYLRRSNVQGLGLFAARDLEKHTMVIEYIGQLIRNEVAEMREKIYEKQNHGVYMFRISDNMVVDATMSGGLARYINHSCHPNCVAEVVQFEKDSKIIIITKRKIAQGEELAYDYKFDFEDDQHKIPCLCGAPNCRKWMN